MAKKKKNIPSYIQIPDPIVFKDTAGMTLDQACRVAVSKGCNALVWDGQLYGTDKHKMVGGKGFL